MSNKEFIHVRGSAKKQAREFAKRWRSIKRQNFVKYAQQRNQTKKDAETAEILIVSLVEKYFPIRHQRREYFDELADALHTAIYLRELAKKM